jgi:hypothetical protein
MSRNKYNAKRTEYTSPLNGTRTYDSKAEAAYAAKLDIDRAAGIIDWWLPQVPIRLPGGVTYRADFLVNHWADGGDDLEFVDVKGRDTAMSKLKRKQVADLYGIEIKVVWV